MADSEAARSEFVCFGRPVRDAVGGAVNGLTVAVAAVTLGLAVAALVDGADITSVLRSEALILSQEIFKYVPEVDLKIEMRLSCLVLITIIVPSS